MRANIRFAPGARSTSAATTAGSGRCRSASNPDPKPCQHRRGLARHAGLPWAITIRSIWHTTRALRTAVCRVVEIETVAAAALFGGTLAKKLHSDLPPSARALRDRREQRSKAETNRFKLAWKDLV